ncbi:MAG: TetR/AcrR family transcriptional regulator [Pseudomonadota bacterium]
MSETGELELADGKRARAKAANRKSILEAARGVFARVGYDATTVRDIIRETNLAAGTFYNYFKSKEEVFEAIADDSTARFRPLLQDVRAQANSFEAYIRGAYDAYFQFLSDENQKAIERGAPHMALIGVRVDTPEMSAIFEEIRADIEGVIQRGEAPPVDTEYLTAAAIGIAREMGDHMLQRRPVDVAGATEFASAMILAGVGKLPKKTR